MHLVGVTKNFFNKTQKLKKKKKKKKKKKIGPISKILHHNLKIEVLV